MPTNTAITSSIVAGNVPPDRNCPKNGQDVVQLVQDFCLIQTTTESGEPTSPDNSVAEQALNTANTALSAVQELQGAQKETRVSGLMPVPTGDSNFSYSFTPPMPSADYTVDVTYYAGATGFASAFYGWRVLESSMTVNGFSVIFDNTPANTKVSIRVVQR